MSVQWHHSSSAVRASRFLILWLAATMFDRVSGAKTELGCRGGYHVKEWFRSLRHRWTKRIARRGQALLCMECVHAVVLLNSNVVIIIKSNEGGLRMTQSIVQYEIEIELVKT